MKIEIVSHCYSGPAVPIYHHLLKLQMQSLLKSYKPWTEIIYTLFAAHGDINTRFAFRMMQPILEEAGIECRCIVLDPELIFRRAIGRNQAAKATKASVVWFTDVDYLFPGRALQQAMDASLIAHSEVIWPETVYIHEQHAYGDSLIRQVEETGDVEVNYAKFVPRREHKAIGGIQIVNGNYCRKHGYLDGTDWVKPVSSDRGFLRCQCDTAFRRSLPQPPTKVRIDDVYRIRHSKAGRDGGKVDHGAKTRV